MSVHLKYTYTRGEHNIIQKCTIIIVPFTTYLTFYIGGMIYMHRICIYRFSVENFICRKGCNFLTLRSSIRPIRYDCVQLFSRILYPTSSTHPSYIMRSTPRFIRRNQNFHYSRFFIVYYVFLRTYLDRLFVKLLHVGCLSNTIEKKLQLATPFLFFFYFFQKQP